MGYLKFFSLRDLILVCIRRKIDYFTKFRRTGAPGRLGAFNLTPNNKPVIDAKIILTETSDFLLSRFLNLMDVEHAVPT